MRNRLLNFRKTTTSTITVVDEQPAEVFRQLALLGQSMKFGAMAKPTVEVSLDDAEPAFEEIERPKEARQEAWQTSL
jgi:hypothetical protein